MRAISRRKFAISGLLVGLAGLFGKRLVRAGKAEPEDTTDYTNVTNYVSRNLRRFLLSHKNEKVSTIVGCLDPRMYGIPGYENGIDEPDVFYTIHFTGESSQLIHRKLAAYLSGSIPVLQKHGIL